MALQISLVLATLLCSLVAGFLFAFAVVVMPGIARLDDRGFLRAFQVIDGVIQRGQPVFGLVWVGSVLAVLATVALGAVQLSGADRLIAIAAGAAYLAGVQLPTAAVNIPLNNELQAVDVDAVDDAGARASRERFEGRWNRANLARTVVGTAAAAAFMILLLRL